MDAPSDSDVETSDLKRRADRHGSTWPVEPPQCSGVPRWLPGFRGHSWTVIRGAGVYVYIYIYVYICLSLSLSRVVTYNTDIFRYGITMYNLSRNFRGHKWSPEVRSM